MTYNEYSVLFYENELILSKNLRYFLEATKYSTDANVKGLRENIQKYRNALAKYLLEIEWQNIQLDIQFNKYKEHIHENIKEVARQKEKIRLNGGVIPISKDAKQIRDSLSKLNNLEKNILALQKEIQESEKKRERGVEWGF